MSNHFGPGVISVLIYSIKTSLLLRFKIVPCIPLFYYNIGGAVAEGIEGGIFCRNLLLLLRCRNFLYLSHHL